LRRNTTRLDTDADADADADAGADVDAGTVFGAAGVGVSEMVLAAVGAWGVVEEDAEPEGPVAVPTPATPL
jgi:hypothetical protein